MSFLDRFRPRRELAAADTRDGAGGWTAFNRAAPHDRPPDEAQRQYDDALLAWRTNPYAQRIIDIITDYTVGDGGDRPLRRRLLDPPAEPARPAPARPDGRAVAGGRPVPGSLP